MIANNDKIGYTTEVLINHIENLTVSDNAKPAQGYDIAQ
jgi:hypothetical protein